LRGLLLEWLQGWPSYRKLKNNVRTERAYQLVTDIIPETLGDYLLTDLEWIAVGSAGKGAIAWAPTVSIKASKKDKISSGLQLTYFVSLDAERIYLSIGLGMLGGRKGSLNSKVTVKQMETIRRRADEIYFFNSDVFAAINNNESLTVGMLDLSASLARGSKIPSAYEYSNILAKCYQKSAMPYDKELIDDLSQFLDLFTEIRSSEVVQELEQESDVVSVECPSCGELIRVTIEMLRS
jgi:hypothetical protein